MFNLHTVMERDWFYAQKQKTLQRYWVMLQESCTVQSKMSPIPMWAKKPTRREEASQKIQERTLDYSRPGEGEHGNLKTSSQYEVWSG